MKNFKGKLFPITNLNIVRLLIPEAVILFIPHCCYRWSENFIQFVSKCLVKSPQQRATATTLLQHSFIKEAKPHTILKVRK